MENQIGTYKVGIEADDLDGVTLLEGLGAAYYLKDDLTKFL